MADNNQTEREKFVKLSVDQGGLVPCGVAAAIAGVSASRYRYLGANQRISRWYFTFTGMVYSVREAQLWRCNDHFAGRPSRWR